jgi:hypothetical protein
MGPALKKISVNKNTKNTDPYLRCPGWSLVHPASATGGREYQIPLRQLPRKDRSEKRKTERHPVDNEGVRGSGSEKA